MNICDNFKWFIQMDYKTPKNKPDKFWVSGALRKGAIALFHPHHELLNLHMLLIIYYYILSLYVHILDHSISLSFFILCVTTPLNLWG